MSAVVSASEEFDVDELFDGAGELRLEKLVGGGWIGYELFDAIGEHRLRGTPILDVLTAQARGRWR